MKPGKISRGISLKTSRVNGFVKLWVILLLLVIAIAFIYALIIGFDTPVSGSTSIYENDVLVKRTVQYHSAISVVMWLVLYSIISIPIVVVFSDVIFLFINNDEQYLVPARERLAKDQLVKEASATDAFFTEINGDWIEFTFNWNKVTGGLTSGTIRNQKIYKKLILIHDDFTFDELDYLGTGDIDVSQKTASVHRKGKMGRVARNVIEYKRDYEDSVQSIPFNNFNIDMRSFSYDVFEWLADRGYTKRKHGVAKYLIRRKE